MDHLASLGLILLLALLAGHLVTFVRIPEVTGYVLAGVALGPSMLGWLSEDNLLALSILSEVALGLILFSVGASFEFSRLHAIGRRVVVVTIFESLLAAIAVAGGILALGQPWQVALLLGTICTATAPASTLMVIRECDSRGPLTDTLIGIIAVNNLLCLTLFGIVAALLDVTGAPFSGGAAYRALFWFVWPLLGSAALGYLLGLLLALWASRVAAAGEQVILLAGAILLAVGVSRMAGLSPLVTSLAVGATLANLTRQSGALLGALSSTDPPLYAIFFVIAGAELDVALIPATGALGLVYLVGRIAGKVGGARAAAWFVSMEPASRRYLGLALLAQAGLAVGLTFAVNTRFPAFAATVSTVVLASVAIFEMIGPAAVRFALVRSGEARAHSLAAPHAATAGE